MKNVMVEIGMEENIKDLGSKIKILKSLEDNLEDYISNGGLKQSLQQKSAVSLILMFKTKICWV